jgi:hypothetical protein
VIIHGIISTTRSESAGESFQMLLNMLAQVIIILVGAGWVTILFGVVTVVVANQQSANEAAQQLADIESVVQRQSEDVRSMAGLACLSDQAKSLLYHEREIEALRETVHAMLLQQDHDSAEALISRMETRLGLVDEARRLRNEIKQTEQATVDEKIDAAVARIQAILDRRDWAQARREAKRLLAIFPDKPKVAALPNRIQGAWNAHKGHLLKEYGEAVRVNDVDRSVELLHELDKYLTPQEAAALTDSARDVFKKQLHNLGVRFAILIADQQWDRAVATGEEIIREYPNSRMSREVREKLRLLMDYATGVRQPPMTAQPADQQASPQQPQQTPPAEGNTE